MGHDRHTPQAVACGPAQHGGIGLKDFNTEQGTATLEAVTKHMRANTETRKQTMIALIGLNLEIKICLS